jgi:hypothetical protein
LGKNETAGVSATRVGSYAAVRWRWFVASEASCDTCKRRCPRPQRVLACVHAGYTYRPLTHSCLAFPDGAFGASLNQHRGMLNLAVRSVRRELRSCHLLALLRRPSVLARVHPPAGARAHRRPGARLRVAQAGFERDHLAAQRRARHLPPAHEDDAHLPISAVRPQLRPRQALASTLGCCPLAATQGRTARPYERRCHRAAVRGNAAWKPGEGLGGWGSRVRGVAGTALAAPYRLVRTAAAPSALRNGHGARMERHE